MAETTPGPELSKRIRAAVHEAHQGHPATGYCGPCAIRISAVLGVVRPEVDQRDEEIERLRELTATCGCGTPGLDYDGPDAECPVHGAIRGMQEAHAEIDQLKAVAARAQGALGIWDRCTKTGTDAAELVAELRAILAATDQPDESKEPGATPTSPKCS